MPIYGSCWYSDFLRYWYSVVPNTETEEALINYKQNEWWAQLTRATFNESGGRLLARCHTGMAETYLTGSKQNVRDLNKFFWIVNLSFVLNIHCSLSVHSSARFIVLQLFHSPRFLPFKSSFSSRLPPLPHPSAWNFPCPWHALQSLGGKCPTCWIRMVIVQDWLIQPLCCPFHFSYIF